MNLFVRPSVIRSTSVLPWFGRSKRLVGLYGFRQEVYADSRPRRLRSSDSLTCVVRRAHNTYGDRCFATAGPRVWNSLPAELQSCDSLRQFKRCLMTFLFGSWDYGAL